MEKQIKDNSTTLSTHFWYEMGGLQQAQSDMENNIFD